MLTGGEIAHSRWGEGKKRICIEACRVSGLGASVFE